MKCTHVLKSPGLVYLWRSAEKPSSCPGDVSIRRPLLDYSSKRQPARVSHTTRIKYMSSERGQQKQQLKAHAGL